MSISSSSLFVKSIKLSELVSMWLEHFSFSLFFQFLSSLLIWLASRTLIFKWLKKRRWTEYSLSYEFFWPTYSLTKLNNLNQDASRSYLAIFESYNALKFSLSWFKTIHFCSSVQVTLSFRGKMEINFGGNFSIWFMFCKNNLLSLCNLDINYQIAIEKCELPFTKLNS